MKIIEDIKAGVPVILADGLFPQSKKVLQYLDEASVIICCDGATLKLLKYGMQPTFIVGDMDSLPQQYHRQYKELIVGSEEQETNDLTKAVMHAMAIGCDEVVILGATGQREDHTLGNIGLLIEHGQKLQIQMLSDFGIFVPLYSSSTLESYSAQQVSIFCIVGSPKITSQSLKYPLHQMELFNWWQGSLNEALSDSFSLEFDQGGVVVFREW